MAKVKNWLGFELTAYGDLENADEFISEFINKNNKIFSLLNEHEGVKYLASDVEVFSDYSSDEFKQVKRQIYVGNESFSPIEDFKSRLAKVLAPVGEYDLEDLDAELEDLPEISDPMLSEEDLNELLRDLGFQPQIKKVNTTPKRVVGLLIRPFCDPEVVEFENTPEAKQRLMEGSPVMVDHEDLDQDVNAYLTAKNSEDTQKFWAKEFEKFVKSQNRSLEALGGPLLILGCDQEGNDQSLSPEQIENFKIKFQALKDFKDFKISPRDQTVARHNLQSQSWHK